MKYPTTRVTLTLTPEQAQAVDQALSVYMRLCLGQFWIVDELVRMGTIPCMEKADAPRLTATIDQMDDVAQLLERLARRLGYPSNGSNGVGHPHVDVSGHRAYEVHKALAKVLAEHREPHPEFKGVNHDGLLVRYTDDPPPTAGIVEDGKAA
jgi:hypothetical protein